MAKSRGRKPGPSVTKAERAARMREIERRLVELQPHHQIERECTDQWGCNTREIRDMIRHTYQAWQMGREECVTPQKIEKIKSAFEEIATRAMAGKDSPKGPDFKSAIAAYERLAKMDGLFKDEPNKVHVEVSGTLRDPGVLVDRLAELLRKPEVQAQLARQGIRVTVDLCEPHTPSYKDLNLGKK